MIPFGFLPLGSCGGSETFDVTFKYRQIMRPGAMTLQFRRRDGDEAGDGEGLKLCKAGFNPPSVTVGLPRPVSADRRYALRRKDRPWIPRLARTDQG